MDHHFKKWEEIFVVNDETVSVYSHQLDPINEENDNVDIWVDYQGVTYAGIVLTPKWIEEYLLHNNMGDIGWHCDHDLVLPNLSKHKIVEAITSLIKRDEIRYAFIVSDEND